MSASRTMLSRRKLLTLSAAGAAVLATGNGKASASADGIDAIQESVQRYFGSRGHVRIPPLGLITGHAFNGGIRYDETRDKPVAGKSICTQYAARIEDIEERDRPGVLAGFNIIALQDSTAQAPGALFDGVIDFLVGEQDLDPGRMMFVSTEVFRPHAERIDAVMAERVLERREEEARQAGDGSGYFAPEGHPFAPGCHTVAIYHPLPGEGSEPATGYPLPGYVEIAEVSLSPGDQVAAIGLERLAVAKGIKAMNFEDSLQELLRALRKEAESRGTALPPGYEVFARA